jgi:transcriptional pleiotropic regulator of transition state genes
MNMKFTGIIRPLDDTGRVVFPKEIREMLNWSKGDKLEIYTTEEGVFLKKHEVGCIKCGTNLGLVEFAGHLFCRNCLRKGSEL